jgi:hypothetical protein
MIHLASPELIAKSILIMNGKWIHTEIGLEGIR